MNQGKAVAIDRPSGHADRPDRGRGLLRSPWSFVVRAVPGFGLVVVLSGCALVWDDADGRRHFIGVGHVSWSPGRIAGETVVTGTDVIGIGIRATSDSGGFVVGYSSDRVARIGDDMTVTMTCVACDLNTANPRIVQSTEGNKP